MLLEIDFQFRLHPFIDFYKMKTNLKFKSLPIGDDEKKIEVLLDENEQVTLRLSTWTEGLGWCNQKTMSFDAEMLEDLQHALTVAKHKLIRQKLDEGEEFQSSKVIQFPSAA